ncbi:MAG: response regulator transcription factor [Saprospiraceae bacterium]|nr:response regulator transcription factor [Saprospiraceae bacterium]
MKIKFYVVEDEPENRRGMINLLNSGDHSLVVGDADTVNHAFLGIIKEKPDALMLDIKLLEGDAFILLEKLREIHYPIPPVIIVTGHLDFELAQQALNDFRDYVIHILQKPFLENWEEKYYLIIDKIRTYYLKPSTEFWYQDQVFLFRSGHNTYRIRLKEIEYIEVGGNGTIIIHRDFGDPVKIYMTLNQFLHKSSQEVVRIHRKYAVNKNKIDHIDHEDRMIYLFGHQKGIDIGEVFYPDIIQIIQ